MKDRISIEKLSDRLDGLRIALLIIAFVAGGIMFPWWFVGIPAGIAGFFGFRRKYNNRKIATLAALTWVLVALFHDLSTGGRTSASIAALIRAPSPILLYMAIAAVSGLTAILSATIGSSLRETLEILVHFRELRGDKPKD